MGKIWMTGGGGAGGDLDQVTATESDVLEGKVSVDSEGNPFDGTMAEKSGTTQSASGSIDNSASRVYINIPSSGRYTTSSRLYMAFSSLASLIGVTAAKLSPNATILGVKGTYTSDANANASRILSPYTAYANGTKYTGNILSKGAQTYTPGRSNQTIASGRYLSGTQTILGDSNLVSSNIVDGVSIFGVQGNADGYVCPSGYVYRNGNNKANFALETSFGDASRGGISNEPGGAYLKTDSGSFVHTWTSGQTINLTGVSTVRLTLRQINGVAEAFKVYMRYGASKSENEEGSINVDATTSFSEFNVDFDVSGVSGSKYIGFYFSMLGNNTVLAVHSVRLI